MKKRTIYWILTVVGVLVFFGKCPAISAQDTMSAAQQEGLPAELTITAAEQAIADLDKRIRQAEQAANKETADQLGVDVSDLKERSNKLALLKTAYLEIITHLGKKEDLTNRKALAQEQLNAQEQRGMVRKPPYSLSFYDILLREAATVDQELETTANSMDAAKRSLEDLRQARESVLKELRTHKEKMEDTSEDQELPALTWRNGALELQRDLYDLLIRSERLKMDNVTAEIAVAQLREQLYQRQIAYVRTNLHFDPDDLKQQMDALDKKHQQRMAELEKLIARKNQADEAYRKAFAQTQKSVYAEELLVAQTTLNTRETWRRTYQAAIEIAQEGLRLIAYQRQVWQNRYDLLKGDLETKTIDQWASDAGLHLKKLSRMMSAEQNRQASLMQQMDTLEKQIADTDLDPAERQQYREQLRALQQQIRSRLDFTADLTSVQLLDRRFIDELALKRGKKPFSEDIGRFFGKLGHFWEYELWVIDENSVTVRKVVFALVILFAGLLFAKYLIRKFGRALLARSQLKKTTAATIEKLFTYLAYVMVLLLALRVVNIPLAAFAFLGGAVAIGIGFGAQNLINNFISGFILMGEKPISINDLIEVDGVLGRVEEVGARCTRIRTGENIDILVPNSAFLEKNITNWTLTDTKIRARVSVGVAYGSPVETVKALLLQAAGQISDIAKTPEPFVLFTDFGDNALAFEVYFWINVRRVIERRMIESRVRFLIDTLFREAGIVIAFPQRDIHLFAHEPLPVRMVADKKDTP